MTKGYDIVILHHMVKVRITITIDEDLLERIDRISEVKRENRSALIERLLLECVTEEEMMVDPIVRDLLRSAMASPQVTESLTEALRNVMDEERFDVVSNRIRRIRTTLQKEKSPRRSK